MESITSVQPTHPMMLTQWGMVDPMIMELAEITVEQAARVLSKVCRYGGHTSKFYSVAEHSLNCAAIARNNLLMPPHKVLAVLCHDVGEVLVGDTIRPIKRFMPDAVLQAEEKLLNDFMSRMPFTDEQLAEINDPVFIAKVREIDTRMAVTEMKQLFGVTDVIEGYLPYENCDLMTEYGHESIACFFVDTFDNLVEELNI